MDAWAVGIYAAVTDVRTTTANAASRLTKRTNIPGQIGTEQVDVHCRAYDISGKRTDHRLRVAFPDMRFTRRHLFVVSLLVLASLGVGMFGWYHSDADSGAVSAEVIEQGRQLYADRCASCHGAALEGQPDWQVPLASGRLPAPPHDASGHTWHHGDDLLFRIVRDGTAVVVRGGYESDMPGFGGVLSDAEIRAVLAYIKSTWPEAERAYQAEMSRHEN